MEAVLVILFILIVIIKHIGACARDASYESDSKRRAIANGNIVYFKADGSQHLVHNDHLVCWRNDRANNYYKDLETNEIYIIDALEGQKKAKEALANGTAKGTTFKYKNLFIDLKTMEPYLVARFRKNNGNKEDTWFYTDWLTRRKVYRKTDRQKAYEKAHPELQFYEASEIKYEDADAFTRYPGEVWYTAMEEFEYYKRFPNSKNMSTRPLGGNDFDVEGWLRV